MISIKICRGTVCHVMGGSELPLLSEMLPANLLEKVTIEGTTCIGACNDKSNRKPPFVEVNGKIIEQASINKIVEAIKKELNP
jgi:NADH:ubiquinone oxidoreductase subunit E